jgi:hypothetical protein
MFGDPRGASQFPGLPDGVAESIIEGINNPPKSEAMLRFEMEIAGLERRVGEGECSNPVEEYRGILRENRPAMTDHERAQLLQMELRTHEIGVQMLAEQGRPVPRNDPKKPN